MKMNYTEIAVIGFLLIATTVLSFSMIGFVAWRRFQRNKSEQEHRNLIREEKRRDEELARADFSQRKQDEWEARRLALEEQRIAAEKERAEAERMARWEAERAEDERAFANNSGAGSGGYVLVNLPDSERSLFHDLLKGFEDYARLKGYGVSFSVDNSWENRIFFKFTIRDEGVVVGPEQVREDFRQYVDQVRKDEDNFEDIPVVTSLAEHNLLVTMLRNRIIFFRTSYQLYKNVVSLIEVQIANGRFFPAQPQPTSVIIQNGMTMDSRRFNNTNSPRSILGDGNAVNDSSINIGGSVNEKMERIVALDDLIAKLKSREDIDGSIAKAERDLSKVRDELAEYPQPNESHIRTWLEHAKNLMTSGILGYETFEAAKKLWELFGV